jgi:hypothetical protein
MEKTFKEFNNYALEIISGRMENLRLKNYSRYLIVHDIFLTAKKAVKDGVFFQDEFEQIMNIVFK